MMLPPHWLCSWPRRRSEPGTSSYGSSRPAGPPAALGAVLTAQGRPCPLLQRTEQPGAHQHPQQLHQNGEPGAHPTPIISSGRRLSGSGLPPTAMGIIKAASGEVHGADAQQAHAKRVDPALLTGCGQAVEVPWKAAKPLRPLSAPLNSAAGTAATHAEAGASTHQAEQQQPHSKSLICQGISHLGGAQGHLASAVAHASLPAAHPDASEDLWRPGASPAVPMPSNHNHMHLSAAPPRAPLPATPVYVRPRIRALSDSGTCCMIRPDAPLKAQRAAGRYAGRGSVPAVDGEGEDSEEEDGDLQASGDIENHVEDGKQFVGRRLSDLGAAAPQRRPQGRRATLGALGLPTVQEGVSLSSLHARMSVTSLPLRVLAAPPQ